MVTEDSSAKQAGRAGGGAQVGRAGSERFSTRGMPALHGQAGPAMDPPGTPATPAARAAPDTMAAAGPEKSARAGKMYTCKLQCKLHTKSKASAVQCQLRPWLTDDGPPTVMQEAQGHDIGVRISGERSIGESCMLAKQTTAHASSMGACQACPSLVHPTTQALPNPIHSRTCGQCS